MRFRGIDSGGMREVETMLTEDTMLKEKPRAPSRRNDPERTKQDILAVATKEFADHGRPYGGRQGGEIDRQQWQPPARYRPDIDGSTSGGSGR